MLASCEEEDGGAAVRQSAVGDEDGSEEAGAEEEL
jgi:hypothetical protein